jgi:bifunctional DNA-binding transcriptional regulator/antitoxin component of YhaV-PrlF toxin-antitoxin module
MVKLQFDNNQQFKITLPKQIVLAKGWKKGDKLNIEIDDRGNIILKK